MVAVMENCSVGIIGVEEVGGEVDEGDGVKNEGDKSSTTRVTMMVLTDSGVFWEGVCW